MLLVKLIEAIITSKSYVLFIRTAQNGYYALPDLAKWITANAVFLKEQRIFNKPTVGLNISIEIKVF